MENDDWIYDFVYRRLFCSADDFEDNIYKIITSELLRMTTMSTFHQL